MKLYNFKIIALSYLFCLSACEESVEGLQISGEINDKYCACYTELLDSNIGADFDYRSKVCRNDVLAEYKTVIDELQSNKLNIIDFAKFTYRTNSGIGEKCEVINREKFENEFEFQNSSYHFKRGLEGYIGTSFNLDPLVECMKGDIITDILEDPDYNPNNECSSYVYKYMKDLDLMTPIINDCLDNNWHLLGTDRILNLDPDVISSLSEKIGNKHENEEYDVGAYLYCILTTFNGKESSKDVLMRIDNLENPLNDVENMCYEHALREKKTVKQI